MAKHIALRRVYEITVRLVSVLFAFEMLFLIMYAFALSPQASQSFRQLTAKFQNILGLTVSIISLVLIIISLILLVLDRKFPLGGFVITILEFIISIIFTVLLSSVELMVYKGVEVLI